MVGFKKDAFDKKLGTLNDSQQSIQTVSLWVIHHRKHYQEIVQYWLEQLKKETRNRQLTYIYLANDVIQNSRKKVPQFCKEFLKVLPSAFEHIARDVDDKIKGKIERVINIWAERGIYDKKEIGSFHVILSKGRKSSTNLSNGSNSQPSDEAPTVTPATPGAAKAPPLTPASTTPNSRKRKADESSGTPSTEKRSLLDELDTKTMKNMMQKILKFTALELPLPSEEIAHDSIDPDKLIKSLKELENSSSSDDNIKKKILDLPSEVYDVSLIDAAIKRDGNGSTDKWLQTVDDAQKTLKEYNKKLTREIEDRANSFSILVKFLDKQKQQLKDAEKSLGETKEKIKKCDSVREELRSHIASLPDLSQLPQLALPSAVDLFHAKHN